MICRPEDEEDTVADGAVDFKGKEVFLMPGFDRTGPWGQGPMTGGARGYCNSGYGPAYGRGYAPGRGRGFPRGFAPGYAWSPGYGRGRGYGYGRGFGRWGAYPTAGGWPGPAYSPAYGNPYNMKPENEVNMVREEAEALKNELEFLNKRLEELEAQASGS